MLTEDPSSENRAGESPTKTPHSRLWSTRASHQFKPPIGTTKKTGLCCYEETHHSGVSLTRAITGIVELVKGSFLLIKIEISDIQVSNFPCRYLQSDIAIKCLLKSWKRVNPGSSPSISQPKVGPEQRRWAAPRTWHPLPRTGSISSMSCCPPTALMLPVTRHSYAETKDSLWRWPAHLSTQSSRRSCAVRLDVASAREL